MDEQRVVSPRIGALLFFLVALAAFAAFLPALGAGFVNWDDDVNFLHNAGFRGLGWSNLRWMATATLMGHWIPLTWLTLGFNYALGGMHPFGYHLVNVLVHAASSGVFFLAARRVLAAAFAGPAGARSAANGNWRSWPIAIGAVLAALVFAVHPLRAESVAWITERRDVLCALFYLLAIWAYLRGVEGGGVLAGRWRVAALAAYTASLLSKSMSMTLPLTLVLLDLYPLRRRALGWRQLAWEKLPFAVLAALGAVGALLALSRGLAWSAFGSSYGFPARLAMSAYSFWFYPWKFVWPVGLSPLYELPSRVSPLEPRFLGPILGVAAIIISLAWLARRWPAGLAAWAQSVIVLAPVCGLAHAGYQLAHDRYSELSGLGLALLVGGGLAWALRLEGAGRIGRPVAAALCAVAVVLVAALGAGAWAQSRAWHDSESLWRSAVDADPECMICRNNLGSVALAAGRSGEAEADFRAAIALRPDRAAPWNNLGTALASQQRYDEAETAFARSVELSQGQFLDAVTNLGRLYAVKGQWAEAIPLLRRAEAMQPGMPVVRENLRTALRNQSEVLVAAGRPADAEADLREALALGDDPALLVELGQLVLEQGRPREALGFFERADRLRPGDAVGHAWLARGYAQAGDGERARSELAALAGLDPALAARVEAEIASHRR